MNGFRFGLVGFCVVAFLSYGLPSLVNAAEICVDKAEFVHFANQHQLLKDKTRIQAKLIAELKAHVTDQDEGIAVLKRHATAGDVLIEEYATQHTQLVQEAKDREWSIWLERGKGFAVGVGLGVLYLVVK